MKLKERTMRIFKKSEKLMQKSMKASNVDLLEEIGKEEEKLILGGIKLYKEGKRLSLETAEVMDDMSERIKHIELQNEEILAILREMRKGE